MHKKVDTQKAPKALGPYSQAVMAGQSLYVSGQLPIDLESGKLLEGTIADKTALVLDHIQAILQEAGLSFDHVVRVEIFLTDLKDFVEVNRVYAERLSVSIFPARQTIQVAALPLGSSIEISCIAVKT